MFCHTELQRKLLTSTCCPRDDIEIIVPDVTKQVLAQIVQFLYSGTVEYDRQDNLTEGLDVLIAAFGFAPDMSFGSAEGPNKRIAAEGSPPPI